MMSIEKYTPDYFHKWNEFVEQSNNGTVFHRLDFLDYHGTRFIENEHHLLWLRGDQIIAVMPMGIFELNGQMVAKSPFGASYGGIVHNCSISIEEAEEIVSLLMNYFGRLRINEVEITVPPIIYQTKFSNYIEFFLLKNGFVVRNADLTSFIDIVPEQIDYFTYAARKNVRKALRTGVTVVKENDQHAIESFYQILLQNRKKFGAVPTHSLQEVSSLMKKFPEKVHLFNAYLDGKIVAGSLVFSCNKSSILDFYWAHDDAYQNVRPINALVYRITEWALEKKMKIFDFGTQSVAMMVNAGNSRFKETFNASGVFRLTYGKTFAP